MVSNLTLVERVVSSIDPKVPAESRPKLTRTDFDNLAKFLFDDQKGIRYVSIALEELQMQKGHEEFKSTIGDTYSGQVATLYAYLLNGHQKEAFQFFGYLAAIMNHDERQAQAAAARGESNVIN